MLCFSMGSDKGPVGMVFITEENIIRMRAGMPLNVDIKGMTPPGKKLVRLAINLAENHEHSVDEMEAAGFDIPDELRLRAQELDKELKRERLARGRQ
jgi:hypothetical protein